MNVRIGAKGNPTTTRCFSSVARLSMEWGIVWLRFTNGDVTSISDYGSVDLDNDGGIE